MFGSDCIAANLILQINKLRYKDGKRTPVGVFLTWTSTIFHAVFFPGIRVIVFMYSTTLVEFSLTSSEEAKMELQVLGLLGKMLTGPTMKTLYTSAE